MSDSSLPEVAKSSRRKSRLARARAACGLTQRELASAIQLSESWMSGVETGAIIPTLQQQIALARALGLPFELVWGRDEEN